MADLHYLSAVEAIRRFRTRDLSPGELMAAVIARAELDSRGRKVLQQKRDSAPRVPGHRSAHERGT
jgi:hypothetical protein